MNEFKGTKGKWHYFKNSSYVEVNCHNKETGDFMSVSIMTYEGFNSDQLLSKDKIDKSMANAKLIAAAPDLLEALQELLPHIGNYGDLHVSVQKKVLKAHKALLKAL